MTVFDVGILHCERITEERAQEVSALLTLLTGNTCTVSAERIRDISREGNAVICATTDGMVIGVLTLVYHTKLSHGRVATIEGFMVLPEYQRMGVGSALMKRAIGIARQGGARVMTLESKLHRTAAHQLYVNLGFMQHERYLYELPLRDS